jgi:branched-chain amino acid transport system permease protein
VLSFGHIAFVAVGAWTMGLLSIGTTLKRAVLPGLFPFLADASAPPMVALALAGVVGGALAFLVAPFLMRLSGLQAGIATFALLGVVTQVLSYWSKIAPPSGQSMVGVPDTLSLQGLLLLALGAIVVSSLYRGTRTARLLRASRENAVAAPGSGINITAHRVVAFGVSGVICGVGGAMWAETNAVVQASQLSTGFTFTVIAMLVLGGTLSLWGAVVGTLAYSVIDAVLQRMQAGLAIGQYEVTIPEGSRPVILGAVLVLMLLFRPDGITRGREFGIPTFRRRGTSTT